MKLIKEGKLDINNLGGNGSESQVFLFIQEIILINSTLVTTASESRDDTQVGIMESIEIN